MPKNILGTIQIYLKISWVVVAHAFISRTQEADASESLWVQA